MQVKGQRLRAFVLQGRAPQIVLGINPKTMPNFKSVAELKGKKLGVTAPGSSTNVLANFVLAKAGLKPGDVSIIGVGAGSGAVAAMRSGQIDAISNLDPVITLLARSGDLKIVSDTRVVAEADRVFGGPMPAGCLYTQQTLPRQEPGTAQALANAIVRADKWIQGAGPGDIIKAVPESYLLGDRAVYIDAFLAAKGALSPDGMIPEAGAGDGAARAGQHRSRDRRGQDRPGGDLHQRLRQARQREVPEGLTPARERAPQSVLARADTIVHASLRARCGRRPWRPRRTTVTW